MCARGGEVRYYIICNWKMNPSSFEKARALLMDYNKTFGLEKKEKWINKRIVVCPPSVYFQLFDEQRKMMIKLGAQNIFWKSAGSYTGQVSAKMVKNFGGEYTIIGHSENRALGEHDGIINLKIEEALKNYITPIVCVGYRDHIRETRSVVNYFSAEELNRMVFAYEPKDAVGTSNPASPERVAEVIRNIKKTIFKKFKQRYILGVINLSGKKRLVPHPAILYGGSVNILNYKDYTGIPDLGGFVVGRESFNPENIKEIIKNIDKHI